MGHRTSRSERFHPLPRRLGPALVVAACALAGVRAMGEPSLLAKGTKAPAFEVVNAQGEKIAFPGTEFRGKVVVLDFWATWCPPCQASLPHLDALTRKLDASKVAVLAVCVSDDKDRFKTWVQNHPYAFKVAYDPAGRSAPSFANTQDPGERHSRHLHPRPGRQSGGRHRRLHAWRQERGNRPAQAGHRHEMIRPGAAETKP